MVVATGPSIAAKSTATGGGLSSATAGKLAEIEIISRDFASTPLDNQHDNYGLTLTNNDASGSGNLARTAAYYGAVGVYKASYVPTKAGTYTLAITLRGEHIKGSPFTVTVKTGDLSATASSISVVTPISTSAGSTYQFSITAKDFFGSPILSGGQADEISIMAYFQDATAFVSPIGMADLTDWQLVNGRDIAGAVQDLGTGTYMGQVTVFKAGAFTLDVKVGDVPMTGSPFAPFTVSPVEVHGPKSLPAGAPTSAVAGTPSTFQVQGRDFYGNNAATLITSATSTTVELRTVSTNSLTATGTIVDDAAGAGVYQVSFTPTVSGEHRLVVQIEGLDISGSPFPITVSPALTTDLTKTTITLLERSFTTGDTLSFNIEARDQFSNLRSTSTSEVFLVTLTDAGSVATALTAVSNGEGTYAVSHLLTSVSTYTLTVSDATGTNSAAPITGIVVSPGPGAAAKYSFVSPSNPIVAGTPTVYSVQARDMYSNIVPTDEADHSTFLSVMSPGAGATTLSPMTFEFGLYTTELTLTEAGSYDVIIGVTRSGGLQATYFKTVSFFGAVETEATHFHTGQEPSFYTQVDKTVDIGSGYLAVLPGMPAQYFSIRWEGKLLAPHTGKFRLTVDASDYYKIKLILNSQTILDLDVTGPDVIRSAGLAYADVVLEKGTQHDIKVEYAERIGQSDVKLYWESDQLMKQIIPSQYLFNTLYSESTPMTLVVQPRSTSSSHVVVTGDYAQAVAGVSEALTLEARDQYGNLQIHQSDAFTVVLTHKSSGAVVNGVVTATSNGIYGVAYTLGPVGEYDMVIQVQPGSTGSFSAIAGSPFAVQ